MGLQKTESDWLEKTKCRTSELDNSVVKNIHLR